MQPTQKPSVEPAIGPAIVAVTTPAATLRDAALYLERHGWTQGLFFDLASDGPFPPACAMGAIRMAVYGSTSADTDTINSVQPALVVNTYRHFAGYLDPVLIADLDQRPDASYSASDIIGDWNDCADRTAAEVITILRDAADDWDRTHTTRSIATTGGESR